MREWFDAARDDFLAVLELEPAYLPAYSSLMGISSATGNPDAADAIARRALELAPHSYRVRRSWLEISEPKWGGSIEKVDEIVRRGRVHVEANPRIA